MAHKLRQGTPPSRNTDPPRAGGTFRWALACGAVALAIAGVYLGLYRAKGFRLPVGFDAPWYVWRAAFVGEHGLGPVGTATRPGSEVLAAVLGAVTGRSPFTVAVLLGPVLAGTFALSLAALLWSSLGEDRWRWVGAVLIGGAVLGGTRLVDENVATLLFLCVLVAALEPLVVAAADGGRAWTRGVVASVLLLIAAGLAHWLFLAVFGLMLAGAIALLLRRSGRQRADGVPLLRTEAGTLATAGVGAGAAMAVTIFGILRAPANTLQLKEDPGRFVPKLTNDASRLRLWLLGPVAAFGVWALASGGERPWPRRRAVVLALVTAWAVVAAGGIVFGAITKDLPPHRFLELLVVVPGTVALAEAVAWLAGWVRGRSGAAAGWVVAVAAAVLLAVPGVSAWYASGAPKPWIDPTGLREAAALSAWVDRLPPGTPFVVVVSPFGPAGTESTALKERTIRAALAPDRQEDLHLFVGTLADLEAGRRTLTPNPAMNAATLQYWEDVRTVLGADTRSYVLRAFAPAEFAALPPSAAPVAPGVAVVRGQDLSSQAAQEQRRLPEPPAGYPGAVGSAIWAAAFLVVLWTAGLGWTVAFTGWRAPAPVRIGLAPAVGAAALILAGTLVSRAGVGLGGAIAWVVWILTAVAGVVVAMFVRAVRRMVRRLHHPERRDRPVEFDPDGRERRRRGRRRGDPEGDAEQVRDGPRDGRDLPRPHPVHFDGLPGGLRVHRRHARAGRRSARRAGVPGRTDVPRMPDPRAGVRPVPDARREGDGREDPLRAAPRSDLVGRARAG